MSTNAVLGGLDAVKNSMVFFWAFTELIAWFWIYTNLREEKQNIVLEREKKAEG